MKNTAYKKYCLMGSETYQCNLMFEKIPEHLFQWITLLFRYSENFQNWIGLVVWWDCPFSFCCLAKGKCPRNERLIEKELLLFYSFHFDV